jgi:hypothetical protein
MTKKFRITHTDPDGNTRCRTLGNLPSKANSIYNSFCSEAGETVFEEKVSESSKFEFVKSSIKY